MKKSSIFESSCVDICQEGNIGFGCPHPKPKDSFSPSTLSREVSFCPSAPCTIFLHKSRAVPLLLTGISNSSSMHPRPCTCPTPRHIQLQGALAGCSAPHHPSVQLTLPQHSPSTASPNVSAQSETPAIAVAPKSILHSNKGTK